MVQKSNSETIFNILRKSKNVFIIKNKIIRKGAFKVGINFLNHASFIVTADLMDSTLPMTFKSVKNLCIENRATIGVRDFFKKYLQKQNWEYLQHQLFLLSRRNY